MMYAVEMGSCDMIYLLSFMNIDTSVQVIIRLGFRYLRGCSVGIPSRRVVTSTW
jgi:hypothetical protein